MKNSKTHCIHGHEYTEENTYIGCDGMRRCRACRTIDFKKDKHRVRASAFKEKHPDKLQHYYRKRELKRKYGMTLGQYDDLFKSQNGVCAICKRECCTGKRLSVDHDHLTKNVRGLLCSRCNQGLGLFKEDIVVLNAAISYLLTHSTQPDTLPK